MLRKTIQILALTFLFSLVSIGQEVPETVQTQDAKIPIKIDEFGVVGECDLGARLDNFFVELMNNPSATGYIIFYQGKDVLPSNYESNPRETLVRNLLRFRNFDASRIIFLRGGFRNELATELFLVPNGATAPEPTETVSAPTIPKDKTYLYDKNFVGTDEFINFLDEFILPSVKAKMEEDARLAEEQIQAEESNSEKPIEAETETTEETYEIEKPTAEEIEEAKFSWVNEKFGAAIKKQKGTSGVIIFYADDAYYEIGKLQNLLEEGKQKIAEVNKMPANKIRVIYGGYRDMVQAEFWVVPKKGEYPVAKPEERPVEELEN